MAKLNVVVDNDKNNRKFDVTINGKRINNVSDMSVYAEYDKDSKLIAVSIGINVREIEDGITKVTTYYSYGSKQADGLLNASSALKLYNDIDGFVGVDKDDADLFDDVAKFLEK